MRKNISKTQYLGFSSKLANAYIIPETDNIIGISVIITVAPNVINGLNIKYIKVRYVIYLSEYLLVNFISTITAARNDVNKLSWNN